jgi:phage gp36-like protein
MTQALAVELVASALAVASGSGSVVDIGALRRALKLSVNVTAYTVIDADPVPSVLLTVQTRASASLPWRNVDTLSVTETGAQALNAGGLDQYVRVTWTFTNMTSCEFEVTGVAHVVYADPADMVLDAVPEEALEDISMSTRVAALITATDKADGYLNSSYTLPITAWGEDLRAEVASIATALSFCHRGFDPTGPDKIVLDREALALKWLDRIADGKLKPPGIVDSTVDDFEGGSFIVSDTSRGW